MGKSAVLLFRISKDKGEHGYGLDAQRVDFERFLTVYDFSVVKEFIEVESGDKNKRPELDKALNYCRRHKTVLLVAKLDRLSRRVFIISMLLESNIDFRVIQYPDIDPKVNPEFFIMLALVAQMELKNIRARTKAGLAVAKSRGVILGRNGKVLGEKNKKAADDFAMRMMPEYNKSKKKGYSFRQTAEDWNERGISTARGNDCKWGATTVFHLSKRIERLSINPIYE